MDVHHTDVGRRDVVTLGDLCQGLFVLGCVEAREDELVVNLEEVDVCPVVLVRMRDGEMEFEDFEMRAEHIEQLHPEGRVEVAVVGQENLVTANVPHHPIGVAIGLGMIPRDNDRFGL